MSQFFLLHQDREMMLRIRKRENREELKEILRKRINRLQKQNQSRKLPIKTNEYL